jgi:hypothetical protein
MNPATREWGRLERAATRFGRDVGRRLRYEGGRARGLWHLMHSRGPDRDAPSEVVEARIRSVLGQHRHRLGYEHLEVAVEDHHVLLKATMLGSGDRDRILDVVLAVPGVDSVDAYFRPAERHVRPSEGLRGLLHVVHDAGVPWNRSELTLHAVVSRHAEDLDPAARRALLFHLPDDVRAFAAPPRRTHAAARRDPLDLVRMAAGGVDTRCARQIRDAVLLKLETTTRRS